MKSINVTAPSSVSKGVSRISVWSLYLREVLVTLPAGASLQPFSSEPNRRAKHASEPKLGQQSQSIEPQRPDCRLAVADHRVAFNWRILSLLAHDD